MPRGEQPSALSLATNAAKSLVGQIWHPGAGTRQGPRWMGLGRGMRRFPSSASEVTAAAWLRRLGLVGRGEVERRGLGPR